ncbi:MAG: alpha/beta hydrolase [Bacteroidales bacterium]|nr:alpha/beta hydrolase [Bacteroidales bacterium]
MKELIRNSVLTLLLVSSVNILKAQNGAEITDSIYSEILKENRTITIRLPKDYVADSAKKYEVIYILDGEWNMNNFSFIYSFAMEDKFVSPVILVALPNTYIDGQNMRDRDFLPLEMKNNKRAGSADKFIEFIKTEVVHYIDNKLSTNGVRSLFGHSYGGLFSMYTLLTEPDLFGTYYCSDPPFGWENRYVEKLAEDMFSENPELDKKIMDFGHFK